MWQAPVKPKPPVHHVKPKPPVHHRVTARAKTYTVKTGDTLWAIAQHVYHNPLKFERLYQLNKSVIGANPNIIHTGEVLHL
jgi:nucleoid-associated protein YgaU